MFLFFLIRMFLRTPEQGSPSVILCQPGADFDRKGCSISSGDRVLVPPAGWGGASGGPGAPPPAVGQWAPEQGQSVGSGVGVGSGFA